MHLQNKIFHPNLNSLVLWAAESKWKTSSVLHMRDWTNEGLLSHSTTSVEECGTLNTHFWKSIPELQHSTVSEGRNFPILSLFCVLTIVLSMLWPFTHFPYTPCYDNDSEKLLVVLEDLKPQTLLNPSMKTIDGIQQSKWQVNIHKQSYDTSSKKQSKVEWKWLNGQSSRDREKWRHLVC